MRMLLGLGAVALAVCVASGCATLRSHRQLLQPTGRELVTRIGGTIFRLNKVGDLPNILGRRDIYGGKVDKGFAQVKLAGIEGDTLILDVTDIDIQSSGTVMDRYKPFQGNAVVGVDVEQSLNVGAAGEAKPYRVRLDTSKQSDLVIAGIQMMFLKVDAYSIRYALHDTMAQ